MRLNLQRKPWRWLGFAWMQGSMISWVALQEDPSSVSTHGRPQGACQQRYDDTGQEVSIAALDDLAMGVSFKRFLGKWGHTEAVCGLHSMGHQAVGNVLSGLGQFNKQSRARRDESTKSRLGSQVRREKRTTRRRATIRFRRPKGGTVPCDGANLTLIPDPQASPPSSHTPAASIHHFVLRRSIPPSHSWLHSPSDTHDFSGPHDN
jgi:hypothetical protein